MSLLLVAMATTNLEGLNPVGPRVAHFSDMLRCLRLFFFGSLSLSCIFFTATVGKAQDVAEAARQERARKENQQKPSKHVYTDDDLHRANILTPEDSERLEAKRKELTPPAVEKPQETIDAQSAPAQPSLGEIARQYRTQKQARQPQQSAEFHLPFSGPALAAPVRPLRPVPIRPLSNRKDPFLRPPALRPSLSSTTSSLVPAPIPVLPSPRVAPISGSSSLASHRVTVQPGDSLWKLAQQNLGKGSRWPELLALNPRIANPSQIEVGAQIYVPNRALLPGKASRITVQRGDALWKIAQTTFGHGSLWPCIARANPRIRDGDIIYAGQELTLPSRCSP